MRRNHYAPVTAAAYVDAILTDAADALSFAESITPAVPFGFFTAAASGAPEHADYPHEPGTLYDCAACEASCHCTAGHAECVYAGEHNGAAGTVSGLEELSMSDKAPACAFHHCEMPIIFIQAPDEAPGVGRWVHGDKAYDYSAGTGRGHGARPV